VRQADGPGDVPCPGRGEQRDQIVGFPLDGVRELVRTRRAPGTQSLYRRGPRVGSKGRPLWRHGASHHTIEPDNYALQLPKRARRERAELHAPVARFATERSRYVATPRNDKMVVTPRAPFPPTAFPLPSTPRRPAAGLPERSRQPSSAPAGAPRPSAPCTAPRQHGPPSGATLPLTRPSGHRAPLGRGARPGPVGASGSPSLGPPRTRASSTAGRPEFRALGPCPEPGGGPAGPGADRLPPLAVAAFWTQVSRVGRAPSGILVGAARRLAAP
jgi:hypothetical protein